MKCLNMLPTSLLLVSLIVSGCSKSSEKKPAATDSKGSTSAPPAAEHAHGAGPNGGVVFELGSNHAEFTVDHGKQQCAIVLLGSDEKTPTAIAATEFVLNTKETKTADGKTVPPMTITMKPVDAKDGKAMKFIGTDPGLGNVADFAGTVSGEIDSKPAMGEFKE
jgi:hypothetical protein